MNDIEYLSNLVCDILGQNLPCVIASIMSHSGSSPRHSGSKMVVTVDGKSYGTIGGSLLEATAIKMGVEAIQNRKSSVMNFRMDNESVNSKGMICGGQARILLDYIVPTAQNLEFFKTWHDIVAKRRRFYFLSIFTGNEGFEIGHNLLFSDLTVIGEPWLSQNDLRYLKSDLHNMSSPTLVSLDKKQVLVEPMSKPKTLYCLGAGHVALPTAHIAALAGFRVEVIDDRPEFANVERFPEADDIRVIRSFEQAFDPTEIDEDTYIVIFTYGHLYDRIVLEQALKTPAGYIGMMASRKKRDSFYAALKEKGFTETDIARVNSPIGLDIEAETPAELAVSIVGELIAKRAQQQK